MPASAPDPERSAPATVLVVEDEPLLRDVYVDWLSEYYDLIPADGGEAGLDAIGPGVDVAIVDRRMPDIDGDVVIERIRDRGFDCRIAIVSAVEPTVEILDIPFDEYLVKPVDMGDLTAVVQRLLERGDYSTPAMEAYRMASTIRTLHQHVPNDAWLERDRLTQYIERFERKLDDVDDAVRAEISSQYTAYPFVHVVDWDR